MCACAVGVATCFAAPVGGKSQHALHCTMYMYIQNIMFISLSSPFSCLVYLCLVGMCVKLWFAFRCHIEQIHKIVYSLNPFVFPLLPFIHHSLYFLLTFGSTLSSYFSFICTSLSLPRNVPADIPNLFFFYIPSSPSPLTPSFSFLLSPQTPSLFFLSLSLLSWCQ